MGAIESNAGDDFHFWWAAARALKLTSTLFGDFEVDEQGRQVGHRVAVVRWDRGGPTLIR